MRLAQGKGFQSECLGLAQTLDDFRVDLPGVRRDDDLRGLPGENMRIIGGQRGQDDSAAVPVGHPPDLAEFAGLPWCSKVTLNSNGSSLQRFVGPAIWQKDQWALPVLADNAPDAERLRHAWGLESASAD